MSIKKNEIINIRVDSDIKSESKAILENKSLSHSKVFRMLLDYIVKSNDIPDFMKNKL